jgi:hypothetical protein
MQAAFFSSFLSLFLYIILNLFFLLSLSLIVRLLFDLSIKPRFHSFFVLYFLLTHSAIFRPSSCSDTNASINLYLILNVKLYETYHGATRNRSMPVLIKSGYFLYNI